jgi:parvulin-like peptidyl-prolyl isomerase
LDTNEEVVKALEISKMDILIMELMRQEMQKVEVTSKEIEDFYETYKDRLKEPEERQIREIVVPTEQEAKDILIQLLQGADFANLAKTRSKSSTAGNGGDLGFIGRDTKFPQFDAIAFSDTLDVGKVSSIFKGPEGYYIIKVEGKRGGEQRNLSEIYDKIKVNLTDYKRKQALENLINKISKDANIEVYEGEIK